MDDDKVKKEVGSTPYDDAFRTLMTKGGNLVIPLINEMFPSEKAIELDARIETLSNELFVEEGNGRQRKLVADSFLHIDGKTYHMECQSLDDGEILVRMFEYDMWIGLKEAEYEDYHLTINVPRSGVLFLRKTARTPERMQVTLKASGHQMDYEVPVTCLRDYSLEDLISKRLYFLFPFYLFNLEPDIRRCGRNEQISEVRVTEALEQLISYLNEQYENKKLRYVQYIVITDMLKKVTDSLTRNDDRVRKELDAIMGGKILEFTGEKLYNEAKKAGVREGEVAALLGLVYDGLWPEDKAAERAEKKYGVSAEKFKKMLEEYHPDDERMQG